MNTTVEKKTRQLRHPLHNAPATATVEGFYHDPDTGRNVGEVLQFPDGHRASLRYGEIAELVIEEE
jgi:hypothetical protein